MRYSNQGWFREQFGFLRRQFLQEGDLPFTSVLSEETITPALEAIDVVWKDRIYTPLVTLWAFLGQVISADHSCRAAVARLIAHRATAVSRTVRISETSVSSGRRPAFYRCPFRRSDCTSIGSN